MAGPTQCPDLKGEAAQQTVVLSTQERSIGTVLNVTCPTEEYSLVGDSQLTCLGTGAWSSALPSCSGDGSGLSEREKTIIIISCVVVFFVLLVLITVLVCYFKAKYRHKQIRSERLAATLERLSIRDPLDELVRRESRRSSFGNPAFNYSSGDDLDTDKRAGQEEKDDGTPGAGRGGRGGGGGGGGGAALSRQNLSTWHYPSHGRPGNKNPAYARSRLADSCRTGVKLLKLFKIWDYTRTRKQFVFAEGLDELVEKGGEKLSLCGAIRVVLEEDGTEIDNDAVLRACAGMVFLLLEQNQVWSKPELVLSVHEYSNNLDQYRYDVDEKL